MLNTERLNNKVIYAKAVCPSDSTFFVRVKCRTTSRTLNVVLNSIAPYINVLNKYSNGDTTLEVSTKDLLTGANLQSFKNALPLDSDVKLCVKFNTANISLKRMLNALHGDTVVDKRYHNGDTTLLIPLYY